MRAVLICNGSVSSKLLHKNISKGDFIVAVDGGANKLVKTKFRPDIIIGDMDSINSAARSAFKNVKMISYPREKDAVDLELALNYCIEKKFTELLILGAIGSRADMTLTNVFLLDRIPAEISAKILHLNQEIFLIRKEAELHGIPGEVISLFPLNKAVKGLTLKGFKYELKNFNLRFGIGLGLSNEFKDKKAKVSFSDGPLVCVHFRKYY
jgi:thiamine pyrophosphokinase